MQEGILKEKQNIGQLNYHRWRNYKPTIGNQVEKSTFIDGDVLKLYLGMNSQEKQKVLLSNESLVNYKIQEMEDLIHSLVSL